MAKIHIKETFEGHDFRFWLPAMIAVVISLLTAGWGAFRYTTMDQEFRRATIEHWQTVLTRLQQPMGGTSGSGSKQRRSRKKGRRNG